ncbi:MAG: hypothetical protein AAB650_02895 [Patescibacteria group bacterium]
MIRKSIDIERFPHPALGRRGSGQSAVLELPRIFSFRIAFGAAASRWTAIIIAAVGLAAIVVYISAVNAILLGGEALKKDQIILERLEYDLAGLRQIAAERESPAWIQAHSTLNGMVAVSTIRYIRSDQSVALAR